MPGEIYGVPGDPAVGGLLCPDSVTETSFSVINSDVCTLNRSHPGETLVFCDTVKIRMLLLPGSVIQQMEDLRKIPGTLRKCGVFSSNGGSLTLVRQNDSYACPSPITKLRWFVNPVGTRRQDVIPNYRDYVHAIREGGDWFLFGRDGMWHFAYWGSLLDTDALTAFTVAADTMTRQYVAGSRKDKAQLYIDQMRRVLAQLKIKFVPRRRLVEDYEFTPNPNFIGDFLKRQKPSGRAVTVATPISARPTPSWLTDPVRPKRQKKILSLSSKRPATKRRRSISLKRKAPGTPASATRLALRGSQFKAPRIPQELAIPKISPGTLLPEPVLPTSRLPTPRVPPITPRGAAAPELPEESVPVPTLPTTILKDVKPELLDTPTPSMTPDALELARELESLLMPEPEQPSLPTRISDLYLPFLPTTFPFEVELPVVAATYHAGAAQKFNRRGRVEARLNRPAAASASQRLAQRHKKTSEVQAAKGDITTEPDTRAQRKRKRKLDTRAALKRKRKAERRQQRKMRKLQSVQTLKRIKAKQNQELAASLPGLQLTTLQQGHDIARFLLRSPSDRAAWLETGASASVKLFFAQFLDSVRDKTKQICNQLVPKEILLLGYWILPDLPPDSLSPIQVCLELARYLEHEKWYRLFAYESIESFPLLRLEWRQQVERYLSTVEDCDIFDHLATYKLIAAGGYGYIFQVTLKEDPTAHPLILKLTKSPPSQLKIEKDQWMDAMVLNFFQNGLCPNFVLSYFSCVSPETREYEGIRETVAAVNRAHPGTRKLTLSGVRKGDYIQVFEQAKGDVRSLLKVAPNSSASEKSWAYRVLIQVLMAILAMHAIGVSHNDLYPKNVVYSPVQSKTHLYYHNDTLEVNFMLATEALVQVIDFDIADNSRVKDFEPFYGDDPEHVTYRKYKDSVPLFARDYWAFLRNIPLFQPIFEELKQYISSHNGNMGRAESLTFGSALLRKKPLNEFNDAATLHLIDPANVTTWSIAS